MTEDLSQWKVIKFTSYDKAWLDFVTRCRVGRIVWDYDIVIGSIANDKVFRTNDLYFGGDISKEECLKKKLDSQICIRSQKALANVLPSKLLSLYEYSTR